MTNSAKLLSLHSNFRSQWKVPAHAQRELELSAQHLEPPLLRGAVETCVSPPTKKNFPGLKSLSNRDPSCDVAGMPATGRPFFTYCRDLRE